MYCWKREEMVSCLVCEVMMAHLVWEALLECLISVVKIHEEAVAYLTCNAMMGGLIWMVMMVW